MLGVIFSFFRWIIQKFAAITLIVGLAVAAGALWLYLNDNVDFDVWRQEVVRGLNGERARAQSALADVKKQMDRTSAEITAERERGQQADKIIAQLRDLESTWDKLVGNREQQKANAEQLEKMTLVRKAVTARIEILQREFTRSTWERDGLEIALGKLDDKVRAAEQQESRVTHYLDRAWNYPVGRSPIQTEMKWCLLAFVVLYFVGPLCGKMGLYYMVAPRIARGRPVRFDPNATTMPEVSDSKVSAEILLAPGERLWVKKQFLQAPDEGLNRKTRHLLDWRVPLTCLATGLTELIEMTNGAPPGGGEQKLTLSNQSDPQSELAVVTLTEGAALILRPSFLVGVVVAPGQRLKIRRRWQIFRWQAWVTLQFRFFEFMGPARLIVAGKHGVRAEQIMPREGGGVPARRASQEATMGFTPNLDYRPARAETFWSYYRGMNPLFDDLFAGRGIFLCQQLAADGEARPARRFWSGAWSGVMKIFGM